MKPIKPPITFIRPKVRELKRPELKKKKDNGFFENILDEFLGEDEAELTESEEELALGIVSLESRVGQLEAALDIAEMELKFWRKQKEDK